MMTRKDYVAIAQTINDVHTASGTDQKTMYAVADTLARLFLRDNPNFDRARFMVAALASPVTPEDL